MNIPAHTLNPVPEMEPAFKQFLDGALPVDGGCHTLALGESHKATEHLQWLRQHLPELKDKYGIRTIGVEINALLNPLFFAYQDGTLAKALGSQEQARIYLKAVRLAIIGKTFHENATLKLDVMMNAMDAGIRVVAYDSRVSYADSYLLLLPKINRFNEKITAELRCKSAEAARQKMRGRSQLLEDVKHEDFTSNWEWALGEVDWLRGLKPEYEKKHDCIEALVKLGHKKIEVGQLTSDALSAVIFDAMAMPESNRLTLGGAGHIVGLSKTSDILRQPTVKNIHGTFGHHLSAVGQSPEQQQGDCVTRAIIARSAAAKDVNNTLILELILSGISLVPTAVSSLNLNDGSVCEMPRLQGIDGHPPHIPEVSLETQFPLNHQVTQWLTDGAIKPDPNDVPGKSQSEPAPEGLLSPDAQVALYREHHAARHINPLLMTDIKAAADAVRVAMNPELALARPR